MFTGIIEAIGTVEQIAHQQANIVLTVSSPLAPELKTDQSLAHNGVCLTVTESGSTSHRVTAVAETLAKTNLGRLRTGDRINLERALALGQRLDGHLVQGHVDATGICQRTEDRDGSREFRFAFPPQFSRLVIEKGSIALNGVSLTVFDVGSDAFSIAVIPYTLAHTTLQHLCTGDEVNLEFDLIGKYVSRWPHP